MAGEHDPYGVVPDGFCEAYGEETIPAALKVAENAPSSSDYSEMGRCPECATVRITAKDQVLDMAHRVETDFKCHNRHHFDEKAPPLCELEIYTDTPDLLEEGHRHAARLARAANDATPDQLQHGFVWVDPDGLEAEPDPGFSDGLPDFSHGNRREAIRRAVALSKPWSKDHGLSLRETAKYIPFSRGWIDSRRQEWRNGQHRHIVSSPEPATAAGGQLATDGGTE